MYRQIFSLINTLEFCFSALRLYESYVFWHFCRCTITLFEFEQINDELMNYNRSSPWTADYKFVFLIKIYSNDVIYYLGVTLGRPKSFFRFIRK